MNRPSRNDDTLHHPCWNQSPPPLPPETTTKEDLNGNVNNREHRRSRSGRRGRGGPGPGGGLSGTSGGRSRAGSFISACPDEKPGAGLGGGPGPAPAPWTAGAVHLGRLLAGLCPGWGPDKHQLPLDHLGIPKATFGVSPRGALVWVSSVIACSILVDGIRIRALKLLAPADSATAVPDIPSIAPLRKRGECGSGRVDPDLYNLPMHVAALFIILVVSTVACAFPILAVKVERLRIPSSFLFAARHFGTGVLIATAFVHLLPTAFVMLGDPCLSDFWTKDYPAIPGAIALGSIFFVVTVEMLLSPAQHVCGGGMGAVSHLTRGRGEKEGGAARVSARPECGQPVMESGTVRKLGPLVGRSASISRTVQRLGAASASASAAAATTGPVREDDARDDGEQGAAKSETSFDNSSVEHEIAHASRKAMMQCFLLELGILFHSIFIGMAISVSIGKEFVVLLVAISFHQTFEGLALGSRIADLNWPEKGSAWVRFRPWLMAAAYGMTTPIGQAIGLATHRLYQPDSEVGLLLVGIMNAISAGLLVFASLVELLAEDFLSDESWVILRGRKRAWACFLVFAGAFGMSLVGAWA